MVSELGLGSGELSAAIGESPARNKGKLRHKARAYFFHLFFSQRRDPKDLGPRHYSAPRNSPFYVLILSIE